MNDDTRINKRLILHPTYIVKLLSHIRDIAFKEKIYFYS